MPIHTTLRSPKHEAGAAERAYKAQDQDNAERQAAEAAQKQGAAAYERASVGSAASVREVLQDIDAVLDENEAATQAPINERTFNKVSVDIGHTAVGEPLDPPRAA